MDAVDAEVLPIRRYDHAVRLRQREQGGVGHAGPIGVAAQELLPEDWVGVAELIKRLIPAPLPK